MTDCIQVASNTPGLRLAKTQQQQQQRLVEACYTARGVLEQCVPKGVNASSAAAASGEASLLLLLLLLSVDCYRCVLWVVSVAFTLVPTSKNRDSMHTMSG
jgi:hypothetical protein